MFERLARILGVMGLIREINEGLPCDVQENDCDRVTGEIAERSDSLTDLATLYRI